MAEDGARARVKDAARRALGVVVVLAFFFAPWVTFRFSWDMWGPGPPRTGFELLLERAHRLVESGFTPPVSALAPASPIEHERAWLTTEALAWVGLLTAVPLAGAVLALVPATRRRGLFAASCLGVGVLGVVLLRIGQDRALGRSLFAGATLVPESLDWVGAGAPLYATAFGLAVAWRWPESLRPRWYHASGVPVFFLGLAVVGGGWSEAPEWGVALALAALLVATWLTFPPPERESDVAPMP